MGWFSNLFGGQDEPQPQESYGDEPVQEIDVCDEFNSLDQNILRGPDGLFLDTSENYPIFHRQQQILEALTAEGYDVDWDIVDRRWKAR